MTPLRILLLATFAAALPVHQTVECCAAADGYSSQQNARGTGTTNPPVGDAGHQSIVDVNTANDANSACDGPHTGSARIKGWPNTRGTGNGFHGCLNAGSSDGSETGDTGTCVGIGTGTHTGNELVKGWPNSRREVD